MPDIIPSEIFPPYSPVGTTYHHCNGARRLFWTLQGPLSTAVYLLEQEHNPDGPREALLQQTDGGTIWHPASYEPLTEPKVSSITVNVYQLERWEEDWEQYHRHAEPGEEGCVFAEAEAASEYPKLLKCCGEDRPKATPPLVVGASDKAYITLRDYISAVHPWLMGLRTDIIWAMNMEDGGPLPEDTKLMVNYDGLDCLVIKEEERWFQHKRFRLNPEDLSVPDNFLTIVSAYSPFEGDLSTGNVNE